MAKHIVKCSICGEQFDANTVEFVKTSARRYAHACCYGAKSAEMTQEEKDKIALEEYIKQLLNITTINPRIRKQIKTYIEEYKYTYSGIKKALIYFFEIRGNSVEKANGGIGIVPYVYKQSFDYYYGLWLAKQKNEDKNIETYQPTIIEIKITPPKRNPKRRKKLFSFLDKEESGE